MKKNDKPIIAALRANGRIRLTELSKKTGLPISTLHERIKKHAKEGLLRPSVLLQFDKMGYHARAHILLAAQEDRDTLFSHLNAHPNVNSLYKINNGWNILLECVFEDMYALEAFVEKLEQDYTITNKEIHYVLSELKRERFFSENTA